MFKNILLATDGSTHAYRAGEAALQLANQLEEAAITILHVSSTAPRRKELIQAGFDVKRVLLEKAHQAVAQTEQRFHQAGITFRIEVALGDPSAEIVRMAHQGGYDLIIIGSRGLNRLKEVILGSVSHQVAHEAKCPVMIVK